MTQKPSSNPPAQNIDIILNVIGESLQLTNTQRENIETSYKSVGEWLEQEGSFFNRFKPDTFPHGSFLLGTTLKPYGRENEFDLDFIVFLEDMFYKNYNPKSVLDELEKRMKEHGTYKDMVERKNRCIRINYTNKNSPENEYHMDMQPACPDQYIINQENSDEYLRVPDRKQNDWMFSSPKVYANWFEEKCNIVPEQDLENRVINLNEYFLLEQKVRIYAQQEIPKVKPFSHQKPLNRAVQLIKRCRDIYFTEKGDNEYRSSSIILTTLAGNFYTGSTSEYEIISLFLKAILAKLQKEGKIFEVLNPVNPKESFTEKWETKPQYRQSFKEFIIYFQGVWEKIPTAIEFIDKENVSSQKQLVKSFGEKATNKALNEIRDTYKLQALTTSSKLINEANAHTDKEGKITNNSNNTKNEPHKFYGE